MKLWSRKSLILTALGRNTIYHDVYIGVQITISGDFINCLEVGIWEEQLLSEDGLRLR